MSKRIIGILFIVMILGIGTAYYFNKTKRFVGPDYKNPVFEPVLADPSIIRDNEGIFYAYGTQDNWGDGMGSKIVPILKSENLIEWEYIGDAFTEMPNWKLDGGIWAPDISYFNDKYYLYYSKSVWGDPNPGIGVATSDSPEGPFEDHGKLFDSDEIRVKNSIDPQLFIDNGTPYLFWGSWYGIWGIELSEDGLEYVGEKFQIAGQAFEAPYIIKRDDYYYFFASKGMCCDGANSTYRVAVGRSETLDGPYKDKEGRGLILYSGTDIINGGEEFVGPGHNSIITDDAGQDWILYHAISTTIPWISSDTTRRSLMIDKIIWEDGWPSIEGGIPTSDVKEGPIIH